MSPMRRAWPALLLVLVWAAGADADRQAPRSRATPIRDSIDRVVERVVLAHLGPCQLAGREGMPCFPTSIEQEGPRFSVADALRRYRDSGSPAPSSVPTVADVQGQMAAAPSGGPPSASGGVGFDPVCTTKNLLKKLSGKGTSYYLYRTWDRRGERPMMTDRPIDARDYDGTLEFHYELVGKFDSECAAVSAWNQALRDARERSKPPEPDAPPPDSPR